MDTQLSRACPERSEGFERSMTARPCRSSFAPFDGTISSPAADRTNRFQLTGAARLRQRGAKISVGSVSKLVSVRRTRLPLKRNVWQKIMVM
jgi:hypothetical protein